MRARKSRDNDGWDPWSFGFGDIFSDFNEEFERMRRMLSEGTEAPGPGGPFIYGYRYETGPDGRPHVETFGNVDPERMGLETGSGIGLWPGFGPGPVPDERQRRLSPNRVCSCGDEGRCGSAPAVPVPVPPRRPTDRDGPFVDIMEGEKDVCVTLELPGIEREQVELEATDRTLRVKVNDDTRGFEREFELPAIIKPGNVDATLRNGVLCVTVPKAANRPKKKGKKVEVKE